MLKSELLTAIQREIQSHDFSSFVDEPPTVAQGGKGVVVPGCPKCHKRLNNMGQFLDHLANDAMPGADLNGLPKPSSIDRIDSLNWIVLW
jgi:hypothetical protein